MAYKVKYDAEADVLHTETKTEPIIQTIATDNP